VGSTKGVLEAFEAVACR